MTTMSDEEIFRLYREGKLTEAEMSQEQIDAVMRVYDREIRSKKASNRSRLQAIDAWIDSNPGDDEVTNRIRDLVNSCAKSREGKTLEKFYLKENSSGKGLDLYEERLYLATYQSYEECICDLSFYYSVVDFETYINMFSQKNIDVKPSYKYRAVCSELYKPIEKIHRYVFYGNTLTDVLEKMEVLEKRSISFPEIFIFGVQGVSIHLFDNDSMKYDLWISQGCIHSVAEVIQIAHDQNKMIPCDLLKELRELKQVDVFISHKSDDFKMAKEVYDYLMPRCLLLMVNTP